MWHESIQLLEEDSILVCSAACVGDLQIQDMLLVKMSHKFVFLESVFPCHSSCLHYLLLKHLNNKLLTMHFMAVLTDLNGCHV